ncbi:hypothetical protein LTR37_021373 [Vermiconidia calcicola]|uniref:Uncharacterized protein n=1 Tax=Vermiconidia calcicola TaxID=1690605 RepID=A0ACC3M927_9PEZI|nr:hypothetical protein LTR37_021373 [Vermiconidia calcicola]
MQTEALKQCALSESLSEEKEEREEEEEEKEDVHCAACQDGRPTRLPDPAVRNPQSPQWRYLPLRLQKDRFPLGVPTCTDGGRAFRLATEGVTYLVFGVTDTGVVDAAVEAAPEPTL